MANKSTLCILGCGNLGTAILKGLLANTEKQGSAKFDRFIACVHRESSEKRLIEQFREQHEEGILSISRGKNAEAISDSGVIILAVEPSQVDATLKEEALVDALEGKLVISVAAGWPREKLEKLIPLANERIWGDAVEKEERVWVIRTLPNIAALVSQGLTAIEEPHPDTPEKYIDITSSIFEQIGSIIHIPPRLMAATTAVGGSTPAFFAIICDAMIDASVAVGVPRESAQQMIYQSMMGTAAMLKSGVHPGALKDQGTSSEGCTIAGVMVLEEGGVRGTVGKALRESVTVARLMGEEEHLNDTRRPHGCSR